MSECSYYILGTLVKIPVKGFLDNDLGKKIDLKICSLTNKKNDFQLSLNKLSRIEYIKDCNKIRYRKTSFYDRCYLRLFDNNLCVIFEGLQCAAYYFRSDYRFDSVYFYDRNESWYDGKIFYGVDFIKFPIERVLR